MIEAHGAVLAPSLAFGPAAVIGRVAALVAALVVVAPYVVISAVHPARRHRLPLPVPWREWLAGAVDEEELEVTEALSASKGGPRDAVIGAAALLVVVGASTV